MSEGCAMGTTRPGIPGVSPGARAVMLCEHSRLTSSVSDDLFSIPNIQLSVQIFITLLGCFEALIDLHKSVSIENLSANG